VPPSLIPAPPSTSQFLEEVGPTGGITAYALTSGDRGATTTLGTTPTPRSPLASATAALATTFLPRGWPASVTPDYLPYQAAAFPAHVAGWVSQSLVTGALLTALAAGTTAAGAAPPPQAPPPQPSSFTQPSSADPPPALLLAAAPPAAAAAAAAAGKWITKDGLGAAGRLLVGSRLGAAIDDDPRRWRMLAEAATTAGLALEVATAAAPPAAFVPLAGAGTLCRAVGKGIARPAFRVVQTHFAAGSGQEAGGAGGGDGAGAGAGGGRGGNVGDVAAKEEVWEVAAQVAGLAGAVAVLGAAQAGGLGPTGLALIWAASQAAHVGFRAASLRALRFRGLNQKRAAAAAAAFVRGGGVAAAAAAGGGGGGAPPRPPPPDDRWSRFLFHSSLPLPSLSLSLLTSVADLTQQAGTQGGPRTGGRGDQGQQRQGAAGGEGGGHGLRRGGKGGVERGGRGSRWSREGGRELGWVGGWVGRFWLVWLFGCVCVVCGLWV